MIMLMENVAHLMTYKIDDRYQLSEFISSDYISEEAEKLFKLSSAPILAILLNSVLVPYSPRKGSILNVSFVFRIFHEYFLASYLVREKLRDFGYPENVKSLYSEIKSSHGGV